MWFFTPKEKFVDDAAVKSLMSVSSQRNLKNFLEAEKNMFEHLNVFIKIMFLLNGGCLAALSEFRPDFFWSMFVLTLGLGFSSLFYLISFLFLNRSMTHIINDNYVKFKNSRRLSYHFLYWGVWSSILSFSVFLIVFASKPKMKSLKIFQI